MDEKNKPRLVNAGSGFSDLYTVEYRGRFLYSKYNPTRSIVSIIQKLELLPSTLVIINSPCLFYGLTDLLQKIPDGCTILAVEDDENLYGLAESAFDGAKKMYPGTDFSKVHLMSCRNLLELDDKIRSMVNSGKIRRAVAIDFSAGKIFNPQIYDLILSAAQEIIATFWKNRITLVKMGRLFSKNIFTNLKLIDSESNISRIYRSVTKPILVCGAGESLDSTFAENPSSFSKSLRDGDFFLVAVDAALMPLLDRGIKVDATVGLESQFAIQKAYIGTEGNGSVFFADLCSRPQVQRMFRGKTYWFSSEFASMKFLEKIKKVVPDFIPPLGSVGLAAVYLSLLLRKDDSVPVYVTGLDFSYSIGKTHAKNTPAHRTRLFSANRLSTVENIDAAFSESTALAKGKNGNTVATSAVMLSYRQNFINNFSKTKNLFDIGETGLDLGLKSAKTGSIATQSGIWEKDANGKHAAQIQSATEFLANEKSALIKLRNLLSKGEESEFFEKNESMDNQIKNLLEDREYLYLHFPDGYRLSMDRSFLTRVRAEIDFFLKIIG